MLGVSSWQRVRLSRQWENSGGSLPQTSPRAPKQTRAARSPRTHQRPQEHPSGVSDMSTSVFDAGIVKWHDGRITGAARRLRYRFPSVMPMQTSSLHPARRRLMPGQRVGRYAPLRPSTKGSPPGRRIASNVTRRERARSRACAPPWFSGLAYGVASCAHKVGRAAAFQSGIAETLAVTEMTAVTLLEKVSLPSLGSGGHLAQPAIIRPF